MSKRSLFAQDDVYSRSIPRQPGLRQAHPGATYDFGVAYPDPDSLPLAELAEALRVGLKEEGRGLAKYPHPSGYPPLREYIAAKLARDRSLSVSPEDVILGDGSSQPNHMIIEALMNPGEVVLTEEFTYPGTLGILRRFGADIRGVACDQEGFLPDALEQAIRNAAGEGKRVKLIYTIPTFQNPLGWVMSLERRRHLLETAQRHGIAILEDDCYVDLRFEGEPVPAIASLDTEGVVVYVGSFSKIIGPGVRLGYLAGPSSLLDRISAIKSGGGVSQLGALAIHRYAVSHLEEHIRSANRILRRKRDAMLAGLEEGFGEPSDFGASWSRPQGGLFIWLTLAPGVDMQAVADQALREGIIIFPGIRLSPEGNSGHNCARLCFGYNPPRVIREGMGLLAGICRRETVASV